jgi:hypothetical protein
MSSNDFSRSVYYANNHDMIQSNLDIKTELENAERARRAGNEGRARVCARRAAGIAARNFLARHALRLPDSSAYTALQALAEFPGLDSELRIAALHLVTRVTGEFTLPVDADLIADARLLIGGLD